MLLSKDIFNTLFILMIPILTLGGGFLFPLLVPIAFIVGLLLVLPALGFYFILNKIANFPEPYFK
ncbi:MAG: hypothetical protein KDD40_10855, partial [Bdellovibrionales bacterium]|nr:hypothetical protein [Bdellovibrionales bacterium]